MTLSLSLVILWLFLFPFLGEALHGAQFTGYNMVGLLCPKLWNSQVIAKEEIARRRKERERRVELAGRESLLARWSQSEARRWARLLCRRSNQRNET